MDEVRAQQTLIRKAVTRAEGYAKAALASAVETNKTNDTLATDVQKIEAWIAEHKSTSVTHTVALVVLAVLSVSALIIAL